MEIKPTYLIMVTAGNNNKYYNMIPNGDNFIVEYGRVDVTKTTVSYPISQWNKKYNEKVKKGYKDVTDLKQSLVEEISTKSEDKTLKEIENESVREIINKLQRIARDTVRRNYTVKASAVTQEMVDAAQDIINTLSVTKSISEFNTSLITLFEAIPRKMNNVRDYLVTSDADFVKVISREQDLLDIMRGQIYVPSDDVEDTTPEEVKDYTILDEMGITMEDATDEDVRIIKHAMDANGSHSSSKFRRAWKVTNIATQKKYDEFVKANNIKDTKLLFHGSRSENWFSIMKRGLKIRPSNAVYTGSMFSDGLYFAPKCQKSIGYTSLGGSYWANGNDNVAYMALFDTAYGKPYDVYNFDSKYYNLSYNTLPSGCTCLHAHADKGMLRNDEIVYYRTDQVTIKYLIEIGN